MSGEIPSRKMTLTKVDAQGHAQGQPVSAQFNPTSLQYTITNTAQRSGGQQRQQRVDDSSAKLTFDLIYDTTDVGTNVRLKTEEIAKLMQPQGSQKVPPQVQVEWGDFKFTGIVDSYKETIDFFSGNGVPLRASLSLGLSNTSEQNKAPRQVFEFATPGAAAAPVNSGDFAIDVPVGPGTVTDRRQSQDNGIENPRDPGASTDTLTLDAEGGVQLGAAVAFSVGASAGLSAGIGGGIGASAGFSAGASAGFSAGASAGFSAGASAGFSAGASAGFSGGASAGFSAGASAGFSAGASAGFSAGASASFSAGASAGFSAGASAGAGLSIRASGSASAGVSATEGAFALLRAPTPPPPSQPLPAALLVTRESTSVSVISTRGATYAVGGRIQGGGAAGLGADVGGDNTRLGARLEFEEG